MAHKSCEEILLFRAGQPEAMHALIEKASESSDKLTALNLDTDVLLNDWLPNLEFVQYRDIIDPETFDQIGMHSLTMAQTWYKKNNDDPTKFNGLSFGKYIDDSNR